MAKIRSLKKDIDYLVSLVIVDCLQYNNHFENADKEAAYKIVKNIIGSRNDFRKRINHPDGKDNSALIKKYFNKISEDLLVACDQAYESLGKLIDKTN